MMYGAIRRGKVVQRSAHNVLLEPWIRCGANFPGKSQTGRRAFHVTSICNADRYNHNRMADFGFREVEAHEKEGLVRNVFSNVASKYDIMNDLMSGGSHRLWKDELVRMMGIEAAAATAPQYVPRHLDVAGGTGDVAFRSLSEMLKHYGSNCFQAAQPNSADSSEATTEYEKKVIVCDINPEMLAVGRQRAGHQMSVEDSKLMEFIEGNAEQLPFESESFDIYTIAFGLRNVTDKQRAIAEAYRVLRKGGRMMILEFSHIQNNAALSEIYDKFSFNVIPKMGQFVANDAESYQYLVESIRRFPKQEELQEMMIQGGFRNTNYINFTFGVVAVHSGFKL